MTKKLTIEEFIERSILIHGDKYDYSKSIYINSKTKVKIICCHHGEFEQIPKDHMNGRGCTSCGGTKKLTQEEFINKSIEIHKNTYNYSLSIYKNSSTKIVIICNSHGEFMQTPEMHLYGQGCFKCGILKSAITRKMSKNEFIKKSNDVHFNKYNYDLLIYKNTDTKIVIICPNHGEFTQTPHNHLKYGCIKCGGTKKLTQEEFVKKSIEIHGNKYNYSQAEYKGNKFKVEIICPKHNIFKQSASNHMKGANCPSCNSSKGENIIKNFLIKNNITYQEQKKFPECMHIRKLPFDFFLPEYNLCIEYDGEQHFKAVKIFGGHKEFKKTLIRDEIKNNFCKIQNIKLLRISYKENIQDVLNIQLLTNTFFDQNSTDLT